MATIVTLGVLAAGLGAPGSAVAQATTLGAEPGLARLDREVQRLAALAGGVMGVGALHLESGRSVFLNRGERFPMASSYKVPIAVQLLERVDRGEMRLDSMIALAPGDIHPGSGILAQLFDKPGVILSVRNLLELTLLISDNSATDVVLRAAGGPELVTRRMRELGIEGIRVDRPTIQLIGDWRGVRDLPPNNDVPPERFRELSQAVTPAARDSAAAAFEHDERDTATPEGMLLLLEKVWREEALGSESTALLLDIMTRSTTGLGRLRGMLPPTVSVAHKTGTIGGTTNDIGIITLPDGAGHVAIVAFVKASTRAVEERELAIAQVARAIYDYFVFNPMTAASPD